MEEAKLKFCLDPRNMDIVRDDSKERISRGRILEVGGNENFTGCCRTGRGRRTRIWSGLPRSSGGDRNIHEGCFHVSHEKSFSLVSFCW